jgi:hypothetical protein
LRVVEARATLVTSGVQLVTLLALDDKGVPVFNQQLAGKLADLMAAAIETMKHHAVGAE